MSFLIKNVIKQSKINYFFLTQKSIFFCLLTDVLPFNRSKNSIILNPELFSYGIRSIPNFFDCSGSFSRDAVIDNKTAKTKSGNDPTLILSDGGAPRSI